LPTLDIEILISEGGADVNLKDDSDRTPLHYGAMDQWVQVIAETMSVKLKDFHSEKVESMVWYGFRT